MCVNTYLYTESVLTVCEYAKSAIAKEVLFTSHCGCGSESENGFCNDDCESGML